jgi:putative ABC transport system substrate-binding protein
MATVAALAFPALCVEQRPTGRRVIGTLSLTRQTSEVNRVGTAMFDAALQRLGWDESRNLTIVRRYAEGDIAKLDGLAEELVRENVELIVAALLPSALAAMRATRTIPIVLIGGGVGLAEMGLVNSFAQPGGNLTGTFVNITELFAKSMQLVREMAPGRSRIAVLSGPIAPGSERATEAYREKTTSAVKSLGMQVQYHVVANPAELGKTLQQVIASRADILLINNSGVSEPQWREIAQFAVQNKILSIGVATLFTSVGGAMYYGSNLQEIIERSASFVDRILRGAKPADLPVELPTKFDLILNLKSLRTIGIEPPRNVLLQATELIQ